MLSKRDKKLFKVVFKNKISTLKHPNLKFFLTLTDKKQTYIADWLLWHSMSSTLGSGLGPLKGKWGSGSSSSSIVTGSWMTEHFSDSCLSEVCIWDWGKGTWGGRLDTYVVGGKCWDDVGRPEGCICDKGWGLANWWEWLLDLWDDCWFIPNWGYDELWWAGWGTAFWLDKFWEFWFCNEYDEGDFEEWADGWWEADECEVTGGDWTELELGCVLRGNVLGFSVLCVWDLEGGGGDSWYGWGRAGGAEL